MSCNHPTPEMRLRTLSNGSTAIHMQCTVCGEPTSPAIKKTSITPEQLLALPPFDNGLRDTYREMEREHNRQLAQQKEAQWNSESPARKAEYAAYLQSPQWRAKRQAVMIRDKGWCQGCHAANATQVHHLTYAHRGDELLWELVAVCDDCHRRAHT